VVIAFISVLAGKTRKHFYSHAEYLFALLLLALIQIYLIKSGAVAGV